MSFSIKVTGAKEVIAALDKGVKKPLENNLPKLALKIERNVKQATVVDTGILRASIVSQATKDSAIIGTNIEYAEFIEYGTYRMPARHMEGGYKALGKGMFEYVVEKMAPDLRDFEINVVKETEGRFK